MTSGSAGCKCHRCCCLFWYIQIPNLTIDFLQNDRAVTPAHVKQLLSEFSGPDPHQLQNVYVQPSQRIFSDGQYEAAGATITECLDDADILLGVKVRLLCRFVF